MMFECGAAYYRDVLRYQSYVKTQNYINAFSETPKGVLNPDSYQYEDHISFCNFTPEAVGRLSHSVCLEYPNGDFERCIANIEGNAKDKFFVEFGGVFYFGLLIDFAHLFSEQELLDRMVRIKKMFSVFDQTAKNLYDFYELDFKTQFFGGDSEHFTKHIEKMKLTYIFICDLEMHTLEDFGPSFMGLYADFATEYHSFYRDLVNEIESRK